MVCQALPHAVQIMSYALSCLYFLDFTRICVVPASGFGQEEGRFGCKFLLYIRIFLVLWA